MAEGTVRRLSAEKWPAVMAAAGELFGPDNPYDVVAFGIGPKRTGGRTLGYQTLVVYVERKEQQPSRPVPAVHFVHQGRSYRVQPDVRGVGRGPGPSYGSGLAFSGLHPGAAISVDGRFSGGVACLLGDGSGPSHLLTAGHIFPPGGAGTPVFAADSGTSADVHCGTLVRNLLDEAPLAGGYQLDVALVQLTSAGDGLVLAPGLIGPALAAISETVDTHNCQAQAFCPTTGDYSATVTTAWVPIVAQMVAADTGHRYTVGDVIQTDHAITAPGDSGTILFSLTAPPRALGLCVGGFQGFSLFEPLARALLYLDHPWLSLWTG